jgi:hypothetical protein
MYEAAFVCGTSPEPETGFIYEAAFFNGTNCVYLVSCMKPVSFASPVLFVKSVLFKV